MDRDAIRAAAPKDFAALSNPQQRAILVAYIGQILKSIEADGREPDEWEGPDLAAAIGFAFVGWRFAALTLAIRSLVDPDRRGERTEAPHDGEVATLQSLKAAQDELRQLSYRGR